MKHLIYLYFLLASLQLFGASDFYAGNGYLPDDTSISEVIFLGAHNSPIAKSEGWIYYQQRVGLKDQWRKHGARAFKVPIHYFDPDNTVKGRALALLGKSRGDPFIALCHESERGKNCRQSQAQRLGKDPTPAIKFFKDLRRLLEENPDEVAILFIETRLQDLSEANGMKGTEGQEGANLWKILYKSGLADYVYYLDSTYAKQNWPTLGELRDANQRLIVVVTRPYKGLSYTNLIRETEFDITLEYIESDGPEEMRGYPRDLTGKSHFFKLNHFIEVSIPKDSKKAFLLKFLPKTFKHLQGYPLKATDYGYLNSYELVKKRVKRAHYWEGIHPNVLLMDFVDSGDNGGPQRVVWEHNQSLLEPK